MKRQRKTRKKTSHSESFALKRLVKVLNGSVTINVYYMIANRQIMIDDKKMDEEFRKAVSEVKAKFKKRGVKT